MLQASPDVPTSDGVMPTRIYHRDPASTAPVVIVFMDGFGIREALLGIAQRIAAAGYYAAVPNLFYRSGEYEPFDAAHTWSNPAERDRLMTLIKEVTMARVMADTEALLEWFDTNTEADTHHVCTVGYCMGGGYALGAAGRFPDRVTAAASYHGGNLATDAPDSPHRLAAKARGWLYIGYAENDRSFPDAQRRQLEESLKAAGVKYEIEPYKAGHGFALPDLPVYDERAAARHFETMFRVFKKGAEG